MTHEQFSQSATPRTRKSIFIGILLQHGITAMCDVRSKPYSSVNPQFNREELKQALGRCGITYVFLGKELGARSEDPDCYENGKVQYAAWHIQICSGKV